MDVTDLLARAVEAGASDLHLAAGEIPMLRLDGELQRLGLPRLQPASLSAGLAPLLDEGQRQRWEQGDEQDLALQLEASIRKAEEELAELKAKGKGRSVRFQQQLAQKLTWMQLRDLMALYSDGGEGHGD